MDLLPLQTQFNFKTVATVADAVVKAAIKLTLTLISWLMLNQELKFLQMLQQMKVQQDPQRRKTVLPQQVQNKLSKPSKPSKPNKPNKPKNSQKLAQLSEM